MISFCIQSLNRFVAVKEYDTFNGYTLEEALYKPFPIIFIGFPSAKDPSWETRYPGEKATANRVLNMCQKLCLIMVGRSTITVVSFAQYSWFEKWSKLTVKKRGDEYNSLKNAIGQQIIDQVVHLYPNLRVSWFASLSRSQVYRTRFSFLECHRLLQRRHSHHQRTLPEHTSRLHIRTGSHSGTLFTRASLSHASRIGYRR